MLYKMGWVFLLSCLLNGKGYTLKGEGEGVEGDGGDSCVKIICLPSDKEFTLKGKNLLPGSKFFLFRVDSFSGGIAVQESA